MSWLGVIVSNSAGTKAGGRNLQDGKGSLLFAAVVRARALAHWNATRGRTSTGRPVDAIICPTAATLAVPHDGIRWWGYSSHWNLLDLPGVVFPSGGRFNPAEFPATEAYEPRNAVRYFSCTKNHYSIINR